LGKDSIIEKENVIGICEGIIYRAITPYPEVLVHMEINPIELWHRIYGHEGNLEFPTSRKIMKEYKRYVLWERIL